MMRHLFWLSWFVPVTLAFAAPGDPPPGLDEYSAGKACDRDRPEVDSVNQLLKDIKSNKVKVTSADAFIAKLPLKLRQSLLFMAESKSIQEASVKDPRVILKSPNSEVTLSFNAKPGQRGYDAIEMQIWDADQKRFNMVEVRFPQDTNDNELKTRKNAKVQDNPYKCTTCHGGEKSSGQSPRPVFDPYRQWAGLVPFSEDRLNRGSPEVDWYKSYLARVEKGEPRFRHLKPMLTTAEIDRKLKASPSIQVPSAQSWTSQPVNTPGLDMSHQFTVLNGCRIVGDLQRRKDWNQIKYAVAGALQSDECQDPTVFLNPEQNQAAGEWFQERGIGGKKGKKFDFASVVADTRKRQNRLSDVREGNELWFLEKTLSSAKAAEAAVALSDKHNSRGRGKSGPNSKGYAIDDPMITSKSRFPTFENAYYEISKTRYALEPFGIQTNLWSYAIDPDTYAHVEFFDQIANQPEIRNIFYREAGGDCDRLAQLSRDALKGKETAPPIPPLGSEPFCPAPVLEANAIELLKKPIGDIRRRELDARVTAIFGQCSGCHRFEVVEGAPFIPFDDPSRLRQLILARRGKPGDFAEIIWDRITRSPDSYNAMPLGDPLKTQEKLDVRMWLDTLE